jgi:hypothetical protein
MFFIALGSNKFLLIITIAFLFLVARFNYDNSMVIIKTGALTVCILGIISNSLVWTLGIIITIIGADN